MDTVLPGVGVSSDIHTLNLPVPDSTGFPPSLMAHTPCGLVQSLPVPLSLLQESKDILTLDAVNRTAMISSISISPMVT